MWYGAHLLPLSSLLSMLFGWLLLKTRFGPAEGDKIRLARLLSCLGSWSGHVWQRPLSLLAAVSGLQHRPLHRARDHGGGGAPALAYPWLPWLLTLSAVLGAQSALLLLNLLLAGWHAQTGVDPAAPERLDVRPAGALPAGLGPVWRRLGSRGRSPPSARPELAAGGPLAVADPGAGRPAEAAVARDLCPPGTLGLALLGLHLVWGLRWLVLIQGQLAPKYGAGVYLYEIAWGPAGVLGILGTFGLLLALLVALSELVRPLLPRHQGTHSFAREAL